MSNDLDDELRADYVAESRELVSKFDEELVALERTPEDTALLNSIFRGFHTVKGGAGFFAFRDIVNLCHVCEDVFNVLRAGRRKLNAEVMDHILASVDLVRGMLDAVSENMPTSPAPESMIESLRAFADGIDTVAEAPPPAPEPVAAAPAPAAASSGLAHAADDPFSEDEFEALLDQLHGNGSVPGAAAAPAAAAPEPPKPATPAPKAEVKAEPKSAAKPAAEPAKPAAAAKPASEPAETTVRIDTERLDHVMNLVGELVLVRNRFKALPVNPSREDMRKAIAELDLITSRLQGTIMGMRMQPIRKLFAKFPRMVREIARKLGKDIEVETFGEDTELDKSLVEALNDPLVHMVRNSVDHGCEMPETRKANGKPAKGKLRLAAEQLGDQIQITITDDGAGIDPERLRKKAVEKGLVDAATAARMSLDESLQIIFLPGLSTKEEVSELSGRGVGMDVVRSNISALNGNILIDSAVGRGTSFSIRLPLTLAIQPVLMVNVGPRLFALPLQPVKDVFPLDPVKVRKLDQWEAVAYQERALRLLRLDRWATMDRVREPDHEDIVVVVEVGRENFGIVVDSVRAREEIVVKPLGRMLRGLAGVGGATVTGDGRVALIVDLSGLISAREQGPAHGIRPWTS